MLIQQSNSSNKQQIKVYLRLKDKKTFLISIKEPIKLNQLKNIILQKTHISQSDIIVLYQGKHISFYQQSEFINLKDKSILHIINKKYFRNDCLQLLVRFILRNHQKSCLGEGKLITKSDDLIRHFIEQKIILLIEEMTHHKVNVQNINLVSNGNVLKKTLNFKNYLIQDGSEIICMIDNHEALERVAKNIKTHQIVISKQQKPNIEQAIVTKSEEVSPLALTPIRRKSQVEKKSSIALSENRSQEFAKLQTFASKQDLAEKQQLLKDALQQEGHSNSKLRKKQKITSDLVRKFQHQLSLRNQQETFESINVQKAKSQHQQFLIQQEPVEKLQNFPDNQKKDINFEHLLKAGDLIAIKNPLKRPYQNSFNKLAQKFSKFLNKNVLDDWYNEPDSPIQVDYPKVQRKIQSCVQWDPILNSQNIEQKQGKYVFSETSPGFMVCPLKLCLQNSTLQIKRNNKVQDKTGASELKKGDFLLCGALTDKNQRKSDESLIKELSEKFDSLLMQKYGDSQSSSISVEYPKLQKKIQPKAGDFILYGQMFTNSKKLISPKLLSRFEQQLSKINNKKNQDYGLSQNNTQPQEITQNRQNINDKYFTTPLKHQNNSYKMQEQLNKTHQKVQRIESQLQIEKKIKLGDFLVIKKIDFSIPKSKLLESIMSQYSHLTTV